VVYLALVWGRVVTKAAQILCAYCRIPLEGPAEPQPDDRVACPSCGNGDRFEAVFNEVGEHIREMAAQKIADMLANFGKQSKHLRVTKTYSGLGRQWRFIAEVTL